ncbi:MAG: hypothetical protein IPK13_10830 [Deltaproteobacteria bacterium]|nr:hypothetical protein [Deltaproteobacteria bacterium]
MADPLEPEAHDSLLSESLRALGGFEVGRIRGLATVRSSASTEAGRAVVAAGEATTSGYRLALYRPPSRTGFYFPPRIGFFSQDIVISGFREDLGVLNANAGQGDIPARVTDPNHDGVEVDINEPIAYALRLRSGYVGQGVGLNLVLGTDDVRIFSTLETSVNLAELRYTDVRIYQSRVHGYRLDGLLSGSASAEVGLAILPAHLAIRSSFAFEWFRKFPFPKPVEFQAASTFNAQKQIYERQRVFVDAVSVLAVRWQISGVILF